MKKFLGKTTENNLTFEKGLFKCTHCQEATIRLEQVGGSKARVQFISKEEEQSILNTK